MISYSRPRLSTAREAPEPSEYEKGSNTIVKKSIQTWFSDIIYDEDEDIVKLNNDTTNLIYKVLPIKRPHSFSISNRIMLCVSKRIELATQLNITSRHGST